MQKINSKKTRKSESVYDSLKAASAGLEVPVELLQEAKSLGSPGFRGSRIYGNEVRAWLDSNPRGGAGDDESLLGLRKKFLRTQIARAKFQLETLRGEHVLLVEVRTNIAALVATARMEIRAIENEMPLALQGLSIPDARIEIQKRFDKLCAKLHAGPYEETQKATR